MQKEDDDDGVCYMDVEYADVVARKEQEEESATISVRRHGGEDLGSLNVDAFSDLVTTEINSTLKSF